MTTSARSMGLFYRMFVRGGINRKEREQETQRKRPQEYAYRPEVRNAAEYREKHEERMHLHAFPHEARRKCIIDQAHDEKSPEQEPRRRKPAIDEKYIEYCGREDEYDAYAWYKSCKPSNYSPQNWIGYAEEKKSDRSEYPAQECYQEIASYHGVDRHTKALEYHAIVVVAQRTELDNRFF